MTWRRMHGRPWRGACPCPAWAPPGGGRNAITPRLLRHFSLICFPDFDEPTLKGIFNTFMQWYLGRHQGFNGDVVGKGSAAVAACLDVFRTASKGLRPTPAKSHYTFNLRDISRTVEGLFMNTPTTCPDGGAFTRAWIHEVLRVYYDRLTVVEDRAWLLGEVKALTRKHFGAEFDDLCHHLIDMHPGRVPGGPPAVEGGKPSVTTEHMRVLLWGDYMGGPLAPPPPPCAPTGRCPPS